MQDSNDAPIKKVYQGGSGEEVPPITERANKQDHVLDVRPEEVIQIKDVDNSWGTRPEPRGALG